MSTDGDNQPFDVVCSAGAPSLLEIVRGFGGRQELVWRQEMSESFKSATGPFDYPGFVTRLEVLSRGEFVDVLKAAGFQGRDLGGRAPGASPPAPAVSAEQIETWLNEMTFVTQFVALRELDQQIQRRGESPRLLYQLTRAYAHLGLLTEYLWNPMHEVFKARALLYAERHVVRGKASPLSLAGRGYVRALIGLHAAALADFSTAAAAHRQLPEAGRRPLPTWLELMEGFCRFDAKAVSDPSDPQYAQLAALLRLLAAEYSDTPRLIPRVAVAEAAHAPQCYRIQDGFQIRYFESFEDRWQRTDEDFPLPPNGESVLGRTLYSRLRQLADLPPAVRKLLASDAAARAVAAGSEQELRRKLILALLATAQPATPPPVKPTGGGSHSQANAVEASAIPWSLLGQIIEETSFYQAWRILRPDRHQQVDTDLARLLSAVPTHPFRAFLEMSHHDGTANRKAFTTLVKARDLEALSIREIPIVKTITGLNMVEETRVLHKLRAAADDLPGDVALCTTFYEYGPARGARLLTSVTPYAPLVRANLAKFDWKNTRSLAADWERTSASQPRVLAALGRQFLEEKQFPEAERLLKAAGDLEPDVETLSDLAEVYQRQHNRSARLKTLQRLLEIPDQDHPDEGQALLAAEYMDLGNWQLAQKYADAAANSGTATGHLIAGEVYEGLQQWERSEQHYRAIESAIYGIGEPTRAELLEWYKWCQRTGQGDVMAAHRLALATVQRRSMWQKNAARLQKQLLVEGTFFLLAGDQQQARRRFDEEFAASHDPLHGLHSALCSDRLEDSQARDQRLAEVSASKALWLKDHPDRPQSKLYELASLLSGDLAQGSKGQLPAAALQGLDVGATEAELIDVYYFLGEYLSLHNQPKRAVEAWRECMIRLPMRSSSRTLAGSALWNAAVLPASYSKDLQIRKAAQSQSSSQQP